jgi:hypothetical protein
MHTHVIWGRLVFYLLVAVVLLMPLTTVKIAPSADTNVTAFLPNNPPNKPTLEGPQSGVPDSPYRYTACATDPDGDRIFYSFDWGDGCRVTMSCCFASGECCTTCYSWSEIGIYQVRACAVDEHQCYGEWSDPLPVTMPKKPLFRPCLDYNAFSDFVGAD